MNQLETTHKYMLIDIGVLKDTKILGVGHLHEIGLIGRLHKHNGYRVMAPPILGRGFSKLTHQQLQYLCWNTFHIEPTMDYPDLVETCKKHANMMPVDDTELQDLQKEVDRLTEGQDVPESTLTAGEDSKKVRRRERRLARKARKLGIPVSELQPTKRSTEMGKAKTGAEMGMAAASNTVEDTPDPVVTNEVKPTKKETVVKKKTKKAKVKPVTKKVVVEKKVVKKATKKVKKVKTARKDRPVPGVQSTSGKIWAICDAENKKKGGAVRANVLVICEKK